MATIELELEELPVKVELDEQTPLARNINKWAADEAQEFRDRMDDAFINGVKGKSSFPVPAWSCTLNGQKVIVTDCKTTQANGEFARTTIDGFIDTTKFDPSKVNVTVERRASDSKISCNVMVSERELDRVHDKKELVMHIANELAGNLLRGER